MEFIKIYIFYIKKFFQARAEYRLNFWIGIFANFITYFLAYISYWIITGQLSDIAVVDKPSKVEGRSLVIFLSEKR